MIPVLQDTPGQETVGTGGMHCSVTLGTGTGHGILCKQTQRGHNVTHRQHQLGLKTRATSLFSALSPARMAEVVSSSSILGKSQFPRRTKPTQVSLIYSQSSTPCTHSGPGLGSSCRLIAPAQGYAAHPRPTPSSRKPVWKTIL